MEVFTLIARKKNVALVFVSYLLVALAAISLLTICIGFAPGILFAVVFGLIAYLMIMAQNTEFEYHILTESCVLPKLKTRAAESVLEYTAWSL
jgi:uncharacterized membrane protein YoaK (UPF0700 family)